MYANVPVSVSGGGASVGNTHIGNSNPCGSSSASQSLGTSAHSSAANDAATNQNASQSQSSSSSCHVGCGGSGRAQGLQQNSSTDQRPSSSAHANQNGVKANEASRSQDSSSSCHVGCGGSGQAQSASQDSSTNQDADSSAHADQNGVNANVPVSVGGDDVYGGDSSADQYNDNSAGSEASNYAENKQDAGQWQSSESSCHFGCGGSGQAQWLEQWASTDQKVRLGGACRSGRRERQNTGRPWRETT